MIYDELITAGEVKAVHYLGPDINNPLKSRREIEIMLMVTEAMVWHECGALKHLSFICGIFLHIH